MRREYVISMYTVIVAMGIVALGFVFPPIIPREGGSARSVKALSKAEVAIKKTENAYCEANLEDVNCTCFARRAGYILAQPQPDFVGFTYANRSDLARGRAMQRC